MPNPTVVAVPLDSTGRQHQDRTRFYIGVGLFMIILSIAGFGPSLIDTSRRYAPPTALLIAHGASAAAWLVVFLTQALLIRTGRVAIHRRLGWLGSVIAAVIIVLGVLTSIESARRPFDLSGDVTRLLTRPGAPPLTEAELITSVWGPLGVLLNFTILVAVGLWYRHRPEVHKRIMVFALLPLAFESILHLSGTLVGRVPAPPSVLFGIGVTFSVLLFAIVAIHDKLVHGRIHPVSVWVPVLVLVWSALSNAVIFPSAAGFKVATWLVQP